MLLLQSTESLMRKLKLELEQEILVLENSDERLMSNGNGNLPRYEELKRQLSQTNDNLETIRQSKLTPEQLNAEALAKITSNKLYKLISYRGLVRRRIGELRTQRQVRKYPAHFEVKIATNMMKEAIDGYRRTQGEV